MWGTSRNSDLLGKFRFTKNMSLSIGYLVLRWVILIGVSEGTRPSAGPVLVLDGSNAQVNIPMASI